MLAAVEDQVHACQILMARLKQFYDEESIRTAEDLELSRRYSNAFIVGGLGQMLKEWTAEGFSHSAEEIAGSILYLAPACNMS